MVDGWLMDGHARLGCDVIGWDGWDGMGWPIHHVPHACSCACVCVRVLECVRGEGSYGPAWKERGRAKESGRARARIEHKM